MQFSEVRLRKGARLQPPAKTKSATPTTVAATTSASTVATSHCGYQHESHPLARLGQLFEGPHVLDEDAPILKLDRPSLLELAEGPGDRNPLAAYHRA